ncbi:MAG: PEP-CTERM sorting domain-containing protein [Sedimentisphaerales bacterium]|nr:PEP-CTERM sorting domain-containing protein [Sedimentisphaerales bacterium]
MMRKLLILFLVLGLASTANALLIKVDDLEGESFEVDTQATITVVSEDTSSWLGYIIIEEGGAGSLENVVILDAAGDNASTGPYTEAGWGTGFELSASTLTDPTIGIGTQFSVDYVGEVGDTATISLFVDPEYTTPVASVNVTVVPEPMTVILLGLGGLFLRRRR